MLLIEQQYHLYIILVKYIPQFSAEENVDHKQETLLLMHYCYPYTNNSIIWPEYPDILFIFVSLLMVLFWIRSLHFAQKKLTWSLPCNSDKPV